MKALFPNFNRKIGNVANNPSNGNPSKFNVFLIKFAIGNVNNPAKLLHRRGAIKFLNVSKSNGKPSN